MATGEITTTELSSLTGIPHRTVIRWCTVGRVQASKDEEGEYRIPAAEAERVREEILDRALRSLHKLVAS